MPSKPVGDDIGGGTRICKGHRRGDSREVCYQKVNESVVVVVWVWVCQLARRSEGLDRFYRRGCHGSNQVANMGAVEAYEHDRRCFERHVRDRETGDWPYRRTVLRSWWTTYHVESGFGRTQWSLKGWHGCLHGGL